MRGLEVGIHLRPGLADEMFVARALGNLAAWRLEKERSERLEWQVLRVSEGHEHHYRLVIRHPDRLLDLGLAGNLERILHDLSEESVEELHRRWEAARADGLAPVPLRSVTERSDFWQDDFWNFIG